MNHYRTEKILCGLWLINSAHDPCCCCWLLGDETYGALTTRQHSFIRVFLDLCW